MKILVLAVTACVITAGTAHADPMSFNDVRGRVYSQPLSELPSEPGLSFGTFLRAVTTAGGELIDRARHTLWDADDFKPRAPKLFHPMGVCAEADWEITESTSWSGLLAQGSHVPAIVRFSTGDDKTTFRPGNTRVFGLAIKLFPTQDRAQPVPTSNLFTLDSAGLDGTTRARFLAADDPGSTVYFENTAPGGGFAASLLNRVFATLDASPTRRPLYPLTEVDAQGAAVGAPETPQLIRFYPQAARSSDPQAGSDFRTEILSYGPGAIRFDIGVPDADGTDFVRVGSLTIGQPVISTVCDEELHFHHHPSR